MSRFGFRSESLGRDIEHRTAIVLRLRKERLNRVFVFVPLHAQLSCYLPLNVRRHEVLSGVWGARVISILILGRVLSKEAFFFEKSIERRYFFIRYSAALAKIALDQFMNQNEKGMVLSQRIGR